MRTRPAFTVFVLSSLVSADRSAEFGEAAEVAPLSSDESADHCSECHGDDLEVVGVREVRRPPQRGEPAVVVAWRIDYRCRECGCYGSILRRVQPGRPA